MKRFSSMFTILITFVILSSNSFAQQWSSEQKDVWSGVQKYWDVFAKGDAKTDMSYYDESYIGWDFQSKVPQNKANTSKWIEYMLRNGSIEIYTLTPVAIWVKGDFAYADYYYSMVIKDNETGNKDNTEGTWTDILIKKNDKWLLIGDRGGSTSQ